MAEPSTSTLPPASLILFARGIFALLDLYPILQFIKSQMKPSSNSHNLSTFNEKRFRLVEELLDAFVTTWSEANKTSQVTNQELENFIVNYFEGEFNLLIEDGSEISLVKDMKNLWATTSTGNEVESHRTVEEYESRVKALKGHTKEYKVVNERRTEGEESSSSEDEEEDEERITENGMEIDSPPIENSKGEKIIDEDGFELVQRKGKR